MSGPDKCGGALTARSLADIIQHPLMFSAGGLELCEVAQPKKHNSENKSIEEIDQICFQKYGGRKVFSLGP